MIVPNLVVRDVARSIAFYCDLLGFEVQTTVAADQSFAQGPEQIPDPVFAIVSWADGQLMLQTAASLSEDVPGLPADQLPHLSGTIYLRGFAPETLLPRLAADQLVKGPETTWYGMREAYIRDPDGYVLCLGIPDGEPPGH